MNINKIQEIRVTDKSFLPNDNGCTFVEEFNSNGFVRYKHPEGSGKKLDKRKIVVSEKEMQAFFSKIYSFVREADEEDFLINNHDVRIEIIYSPYHKEVIDEIAIFRDGVALTNLIDEFIMDHDKM